MATTTPTPPLHHRNHHSARIVTGRHKKILRPQSGVGLCGAVWGVGGNAQCALGCILFSSPFGNAPLASTGPWGLPWGLDPIRAVARWPGPCTRAAAGGPGSWGPKDPVPGANEPNLQHTQQPKVQAWQPPSKKLIFKPFFLLVLPHAPIMASMQQH